MQVRVSLILFTISAGLLAAEPIPFEGRWHGAVEMKDQGRIETVIDADEVDGNWVLRLTQASIGRFHQPVVTWNIEGTSVMLSPFTEQGSETWQGNVAEDGSTFSGQVLQDGAGIGRFRLTNRPLVQGAGVQTWGGSVIVPGRDFETIRLHLLRGDDRWTGDVDLPERNLAHHPVEIQGEGNSLVINLPLDVRLRMISPTPLEAEDGPEQVMVAWHEGDVTTAFMLRRKPEGRELVEPLYPQTPGTSLPYHQQNEELTHPIGHRLGVTLAMPEGDGPHPAVVLVPGIGGRERDDRADGHRFQAVWADALARSGIASVRFDDRGVGQSSLPEGMEPQGRSITDETMEVRYLVEWLAAQPGVDPAGIGIVGWEYGGWVAMSTAAGLHREVAYIVLLSTPGLPMGEILVGVLGRQLAAAPVDQERAQAVLRAYRTLLDVARDSRASEAELRELAERYLAARQQLAGDVDRPVPEREIDKAMKDFASPSMRRIHRFEPRMILPRLRCPVLAVGGTADVKVPSALNLPEIEEAAQRTGVEIDLVEIQDVNHRLQPVDPDRPADSSRIRATIDPRAMRAVTDWIMAVAGPLPPRDEAKQP